MSDTGPVRARPATLDALPFQRARAVRWFSPGTLARTAHLVALSSVFANFSDKREVQAALAPGAGFHDLSDLPSPWVDYVSDIGDGFDSTYSVAYLLAQEELRAAPPDSTPGAPGRTTSRGAALVMGGDEVYPYSSTALYEQRTKGPYNAASPRGESPDRPLFAIPGNHDWYDGLTSFLRFFCQGSSIGAWRTQQRRSYFAVRLPQHWWLLGIDIQFDTYFDAPQIDYFRAVAEQIGPEDGIILCTAKPSWVEGGIEGSKAYATLDYFITRILGKPPEQVRLMIAGDKHHYARYVESDGSRTLMTCGGGGAYLSATEKGEPLVLPPASLHSDDVDPVPGTTFDWQAAYPDPDVSARMRWRVLWRLPLRNPRFLALMCTVQTLLAYTLVASTRRPSPSLDPVWDQLQPSLSGALVGLGRPTVILAAALLLAVTVGFARQGGAGRLSTWLLGLPHGILHLGCALGAVWLAATLPVQGWPDSLALPLRLVTAGVTGGLVATLLTASYLWLASTVGVHENEVFSAQSIEDYKCFLRLELLPASLRIHPIAIDRVCHAWQVSPTGSWLVPADGHELAPRLIEEPFEVFRRAGRPPAPAESSADTMDLRPTTVPSHGTDE